MKKGLSVFLLAVVAMIAGTGTSLAKPQIKLDLKAIAAEFSELEESVRDEKWSNVSKDLEAVETRMTGILKQIQKTGGKDLSKDFSFLMSVFQKSISQKNEEKAAKNFIALRRFFFENLNHFEFDSPPVLYFMKDDLDEILVEAREGEWDDVALEADELKAFFKITRPALAEKKVPAADLDRFETLLEKISASVKSKNKADVQGAVDQLRPLIERFRKA